MKSERGQASQFDQAVLDLYDDYAHGRITRRQYLKGLTAFAVGSVTVEALLQALAPNYAWAQEVATNDPRIKTEKAGYDSPKGGGKISGLLAYPSEGERFPTVLVIHENRGLNPYIEDVTRRLAVAGFLAFAPDALSPLGGYPGNDDEGRAMQRRRDRRRNDRRLYRRRDLVGSASEIHRQTGCGRLLLWRWHGQYVSCTNARDPGCRSSVLRQPTRRIGRTENQISAVDSQCGTRSAYSGRRGMHSNRR